MRSRGWLALTMLGLGLVTGTLAQTPDADKVRATALRSQIEQLESRLAALRKQLAAIEGPSTQVAGTQTAPGKANAEKVLGVIELFELVPKELWPDPKFPGNDDRVIGARHGWCDKNLGGLSVQVQITIKAVSETSIVGEINRIKLCGQTRNLTVVARMADDDIATPMKGKKIGDRITVDGVVKQVRIDAAAPNADQAVNFRTNLGLVNAKVK